MQAKLRRAMTVTHRISTQRYYNRIIPSEPPNLLAAAYQESPELRDRYYLEGVGYLVGDISCRFNARSCYLRCAVNPQGPCQDCRHYEPR